MTVGAAGRSRRSADRSFGTPWPVSPVVAILTVLGVATKILRPSPARYALRANRQRHGAGPAGPRFPPRRSSQ